MLLQAYFARKVSEDAFLLLDQEFIKYQNKHPQSTSYTLKIHDKATAAEMKRIALHLSDAGYDVSSTAFYKFEIDWFFAEAGRTGKINICNSTLKFTRSAGKKMKNNI